MNKWIQEYQCVSCIRCSSDNCYIESAVSIACYNHRLGTFLSNAGNIFLGLPVGFNRPGPYERKVEIFETFEGFNITWGKYDKFNCPVWKYKNEHGHIIVRGLSPRINIPFLHIFLEDCSDDIQCIEIYENDIENMD